MAKFYFTKTNINIALANLLIRMKETNQKSIQLKLLTGNIHLPGGGIVFSNQATVSFTIDGKISIKREDREEEIYRYQLNNDTDEWIKQNKIPIHKAI